MEVLKNVKHGKNKGKSFKPLPLECDVNYDNIQNTVWQKNFVTTFYHITSLKALTLPMDSWCTSISQTLSAVPHKKSSKVNWLRQILGKTVEEVSIQQNL